MVTKKQKIIKKLQLSRTTLIVTAVLFFSIVALVMIFLSQKPPQEAKSAITQLSSDNMKNKLKSPAVQEAKAIADKYFEAASTCDLEKANSLRLLPKNITLTKEECQKECPGGLKYKYIKPVSYNNSSKSGGTTIEIATFDYVFECGDKTNPTLMQMIRSSDDNTWLVFNTG